ncbi:MAG: tRNA lysidine(34) synthetase TilS [Candidatus Omnitrophica bacterium]|nr:tRNA lysidine(34) synthetase TilS [Candidatus Omnitrophota bacterium]
MSVEEVFANTIEEYQLLKKKDKLILGVSGGPDSMCLLNLFAKIKETYKLYLICAHFNHSLRPEADDEEEFVRLSCKELDIKFVSEKKDVRRFFEGDSLEQTARNLRYNFFINISRQFKIKKIALAHHKDDVVETVIMNIIRGTAIRGLRGISYISKFKNLIIIRPLLNLRKNEILDWLGKNKIYYKIDKSNFEDNFLRNKIRLKILPLLEELNPNIVNAIFNLSKVASFDYELIYNFSKNKFNLIKKQWGINYIKLDINQLKAMDMPTIFNIIRIAIEELKGNLRKLEFKHFEEIIKLIYKKPILSVVNLPDLEVKKEENWLTIKLIAFL